jgi:NAD(P)-dependent dehydrogenase (short-subunit alcohol dehydrogenase family)
VLAEADNKNKLMNLHLDNKHVVIAGGSSGIGFACACEFLNEGATVTIISRNSELLLQSYTLLLELYPLAQGKLFTYLCDLTDAVAVDQVVDQIEDSVGPIDVLVNSTGTPHRTDAFNLSADDWHSAMSSKYFSYMNVITPVIDKMKIRGQGSIVNVAGTGGKSPRPYRIPGGAASSAIMAATVGLAAEFGKFGVRLNVVNPDVVLTGNHLKPVSLKERLESVTLENAVKMAQPDMPFGRLSLSKEIADAVVFLSSSRASYISGTILTIDGAANPVI